MNIQGSLIGVHDDCTYKPLLVFRMMPENEHERRIMARAGFGGNPERQGEYVFFYDMNIEQCTYNESRLVDQHTIAEAVSAIKANHKNGGAYLPFPGSFIDCEYLRGEKDTPMTFEQEFDYPYGVM